MRQIGLMCLSAIASVSLIGCQQVKSDDSKKLDEIQQQLAKLEKMIEAGGGAPGAARAGAARPAQPQRPPGPNPQSVYAVPIAGSPFDGAVNAKVTVVEAFEFA